MRLIHLRGNLDYKLSLSASFFFLVESCLSISLRLQRDTATIVGFNFTQLNRWTPKKLAVLIHRDHLSFPPSSNLPSTPNHAYIVVHLVCFGDIYLPYYILPVDRFSPAVAPLKSTAIYTCAVTGGLNSLCHILTYHFGAEERGCVPLAATAGAGLLTLRLAMGM